MLIELRLQNFRCFNDHQVPFKPCTIIVGHNNAGKSTLLDALRLVSIATTRYKNLPLKNIPGWGNLPAREMGFSPSIEGIGFNTQNIFHRYGEAPAIITAKFSNKNSAKIYIGPEGKLHIVLIAADGAIVKSKGMIPEGFLPRLEILPQVAPVQDKEIILEPDYVRRNLSSSLAPAHFRNQLNLLYENLPKLQSIVENTWPGLRVEELLGAQRSRGTELELLIRNEDYVSELSTMGHGLQMWLQTMWFLSRVDKNSSVALDEPDVYMHPDLQRKLIRYLRNIHSQVIVTTHSVEIMSEIEPDHLLVIDRSQNESKFATSMPAAQRVLERLGSAQNLQLAKLWHARRCLLVEGKDQRYLADFYDVIFPQDNEGLTSIPSMSIGGWGGWQYAIGSSMLLQNSGGEHISVYCILDSDYHTEDQKETRHKQAKDKQINLHIWLKKEIENYLLVSSAIQRLIAARVANRVVAPSIEEIDEKIDEISSKYYDDIFDAMSVEILATKRELGSGGANKATREKLDPLWQSVKARRNITSGKKVLSELFQWVQEEFGVSLTNAAIINSMQPHEVDSEITDLLKQIKQGL